MSASVVIALFVVVTIGSISAIRFRRALLLQLPFLAALNGLPLHMGTASVRLDQLLACALTIPMLMSWITRRERPHVDLTAWLLAALLAVNVLSSAVNSPLPMYSLQQCGNLMTAWLVYLVLINTLVDRALLIAFFANVLWAALFACLIGIAAFALSVAGIDVGGAEVGTSAAENLTQAYGAYGTMVEPNIFGSYAAAHLLIAAGVLLAVPRERLPWRPLLLAAVAIAAFIGLVLSFTRAAWLSAIVGGVFFTAFSRRSVRVRVPWRAVVIVLVIALAGIAALYVMPTEAGTLFRYKLANLVNPASQTGRVRLFSWAVALDQTDHHWLLGRGTYTFAPLAAEGADFQRYENWRNLWIGNYLLLALHDTGVIGLSLLVAALWTVVRKSFRRRHQSASHSPLLGASSALGAAFVSMCIAFLATTGFSFGFSWMIAGVVAACARMPDAT